MNERESLFHSLRRKVGWWSWKVYGNVLWYWPRAQARRRVRRQFADFYAAHGETYKAPRPWGLP